MPYKLLLADDSVTIQRVIELTFADEDIQVIAVGDGRQAIERIAAERPDIVLADVGMPERDGFEVASFVKQDPRLCAVPVLLLTGAFEPVDEARVRAVGCDGVLAKPFEPQLLIARVKELLARRPADAGGVPVVAAPTAEVQDEPLVIPPDDAPSGLNNLSLSTSEPADSRASVDEYFDRLDAAFSTLADPGRSPDAAPSGPPIDGWAGNPDSAGAWTSPILPAEAEPAGVAGVGVVPDVAPSAHAWAAPTVAVPLDTVPPAPAAVPAPADVVVQSTPSVVNGAPPEVAAAFEWLLASEQGQPVPQDAPLPAAAPRPAALETIVDEVARRVIDRLADAGVRDQVADIVSRVAERLVREEIDRLKAGLQ